MKKITTLLAMLLLMGSFAACGAKQNPVNGSGATTTDTSTTDTNTTMSPEEQAREDMTAPDENRPYIVSLDELSANADADTIDANLSNGKTVSIKGVCGDRIMGGPATEFDRYEGEDFALLVPFNPMWGTSEFGYALVDQHTDETTGREFVLFGAPMFIECSWGRSFNLEKTDPKAPETVIKEIKDNKLASDKPKEQDIEGLRVVSYTEAFMGNPRVLIIFGRDHNYILRGGSADLTVDDVVKRFSWK